MKLKIINFFVAIIFLTLITNCSSDDKTAGQSNAAADPNQALIDKLAGSSTKTWYVSAAETGHLGIGDNNSDNSVNFYGNIYQADSFAFANNPASGCYYDNVLQFSVLDGSLKFSINNNGHTYFNAGFLSVAGGSGAADSCLGYDASGTKSVTISDSDSFVVQSGISGRTTGKAITFSNNGFMGYYIGQSTYEILSLTDTRMVVRAVLASDPTKAIYQIFTTTAPHLPANENFTNLVWSEEFNVDGAPNPANWSYNLGTNGGWGNNELENYTNSPANSVVSGGTLKITAIKENSGGAAYSSARLVSENKFDFTYGKAVIRAKLPADGGTWPAIWMLGKNYPTNAWPACGEIDIMEHIGNNPNVIYGTLHYPGHSGANGNGGTTSVPNLTADFHNYSVVWNADVIKFYVDDTLYHSFVNSPSTPFNLDFFFILNLAMGGDLGGTVDPAFTQATMEIDYVHVYQ